MTEQISHTVRNSIIGALVTAGASALIPVVREWLWSGFQAVGAGFAYCWSLLVAVYPVPGWLILIGVTLIAPVLLSIIRNMRKPEVKELTWLDLYTEDRIESVVWRWHYVGSQIMGTAPYCPSCEAHLVYSEQYDRGWPRTVNRTEFHCEHCGVVRTSINGDHDYAIAKVEREIDRRIRTGEWKHHG